MIDFGVWWGGMYLTMPMGLAGEYRVINANYITYVNICGLILDGSG